MHRSDAYSSTCNSRGTWWLPSPEVCRMGILVIFIYFILPFISRNYLDGKYRSRYTRISNLNLIWSFIIKCHKSNMMPNETKSIACGCQRSPASAWISMKILSLEWDNSVKGLRLSTCLLSWVALLLVINLSKFEVIVFFINPVPNKRPFWDRPKFKEAANDNWNAAFKWF